MPEPRTAGLELYVRAAAFAADKHRTQRRKDADASPYINHPLQLANVLANEAGVKDIHVLCAAVLHDTIEDTKTTFDELVEQFGAKIAGIVNEVTDDKQLLKPERKQAQIDHAAQLSKEAKLVKLADKICNLRDIVDFPPFGWSTERKENYFDWAKQVIDRLRGAHAGLEAIFDGLYARRSELR